MQCNYSVTRFILASKKLKVDVIKLKWILNADNMTACCRNALWSKMTGKMSEMLCSPFKQNGCGQNNLLCLTGDMPCMIKTSEPTYSKCKQTLPYCAPASNIATFSDRTASVPLTVPDISVNNYIKITITNHISGNSYWAAAQKLVNQGPLKWGQRADVGLSNSAMGQGHQRRNMIPDELNVLVDAYVGNLPTW